MFSCVALRVSPTSEVDRQIHRGRGVSLVSRERRGGVGIVRRVPHRSAFFVI